MCGTPVRDSETPGLAQRGADGVVMGGDSGVSGSRSAFSIRPISASANFVGIGLASTNSLVWSGISRSLSARAAREVAGERRAAHVAHQRAARRWR